MLSVDYRFHGHGSLRYVYKNGGAVRSHLMTIKHTTNPRRRRSRFAVVVSKKVYKRAVGRNRMRRRVYEIIRSQLPHFAPGSVDVVIIISSSEVMTMSSPDLHEAITQLFAKAGLYKTSQSGILVPEE